MKKPTVTIVTAALNAADYIEKAIQSVKMQTYPHIEYIVMDGGSTDTTEAIAKKYGVSVFTGKDASMYDALNKGFARTAGDICTWLDADNFYESEDCIAKVVEAFELGADMVITNGHRWYPAHNDREAIEPAIPTFTELLNTGNTLVPECTFFTRELFEKVGGLDISYRLLADYDLWIRMLRQKPRITKLAITSATYVVRENALLREGLALSWHESFRIGKEYGRKAGVRLALAIRYPLQLLKHAAASELKRHPRAYRWYAVHLRPLIKRVY